MLLRPEEVDPHTSVNLPRGNPPASESISPIPLETISSAGRTSSREAGVTPANLGMAASRCQTSMGPCFSAKATGWPKAGTETSAEDIGTSGFQGTSKRILEESWKIRFLFAYGRFCYGQGKLVKSDKPSTVF
jgi:hypothetical protein